MAVKRSPETDRRRKRLIQLVESLPEAEACVIGAKSEHLALKVRGKTLGYYSYDHHGDGLVAVWCKRAPGDQARLVEENPRHFFVPAYVGKKGWLGVRLDLAKVEWSAIAYLLRTAYRLTAPRALAAKLGDRKSVV